MGANTAMTPRSASRTAIQKVITLGALSLVGPLLFAMIYLRKVHDERGHPIPLAWPLCL